MPGIYRLKGTIKHYDWGGTSFLPSLLHIKNPGDRPFAEYWLGTHPQDKCLIELPDQHTKRLNDYIAENPSLLGNHIQKKFGRLPYLLKVLDVKDMLSIQVHPSKAEAEKEFTRENAENIPLNSPRRNYKDDNHKPELMVALSDFWLLHGFKPEEKLRTILQSIPEWKPLLEIFNTTGYDQLYKTVMEMPLETVNQLLQPLLDRIIPLYKKNQLTKNNEDFWAARAALIFNQQSVSGNQQPLSIDRGIFSIYFFNLLQLKKGEGIFQHSGVPHAYLEGQNVEIMADSDNVLRGGLTNKHVDVKELMKHIQFEETVPVTLHPQKNNNNEEVYMTAVPDFRLNHFKLKEEDVSSFKSATGEILLLIEGKVLILSDSDELELSKGEAAFIPVDSHITIKALPGGDLFRATVPVHTGE